MKFLVSKIPEEKDIYRKMAIWLIYYGRDRGIVAKGLWMGEKIWKREDSPNQLFLCKFWNQDQVKYEGFHLAQGKARDFIDWHNTESWDGFILLLGTSQSYFKQHLKNLTFSQHPKRRHWIWINQVVILETVRKETFNAFFMCQAWYCCVKIILANKVFFSLWQGADRLGEGLSRGEVVWYSCEYQSCFNIKWWTIFLLP